jgi:hypothetical protein
MDFIIAVIRQPKELMDSGNYRVLIHLIREGSRINDKQMFHIAVYRGHFIQVPILRITLEEKHLHTCIGTPCRAIAIGDNIVSDSEKKWMFRRISTIQKVISLLPAHTISYNGFAVRARRIYR